MRLLTLFPNFDKRRARRVCSRWKYVLSKKLAIMRQLFLPINESVTMQNELLSAYMDCCVCENEETMVDYLENDKLSSTRTMRSRRSSRMPDTNQSYNNNDNNNKPSKSQHSNTGSRRISAVSKIIPRSKRSLSYTPDSSGPASPEDASPVRGLSRDSTRAEGPDFMNKLRSQNYVSSRSLRKHIPHPQKARRDLTIIYNRSEDSVFDEEPIGPSSPPDPIKSQVLAVSEEPSDRLAEDMRANRSSMTVSYRHRDDDVFKAHGRKYYDAFTMPKSSTFQNIFARNPFPPFYNRSLEKPAPLSLSCATWTAEPRLSVRSTSAQRSASYQSDVGSQASRRDDIVDYDIRSNEDYIRNAYRSYYSRNDVDRDSSVYSSSRSYAPSSSGGHSSKYPPFFKPSPHQHHSHHHGHEQHQHISHHQNKDAPRAHSTRRRGFIEHRFHRPKPKNRFHPHDIEPYLKHEEDRLKQLQEETRKSRFDHHSNFPNNHKVKHVKASKRAYSKVGESSKKVVVTKRRRHRK